MCHLRTIPLILCTIVLVTADPAPAPQPFTENPCISQSTCHECIRTPSCAWCSDTDFNGEKRCFQPSNPQFKNCKDVYNPDNIITITANASLTQAKTSQGGGFAGGYGYQGSQTYSESHGVKWSHSENSGGYEGANIVQISPQRMSLTLRAKQKYSVYMWYTQAEDYPVDLYYLMDLSKSMEDDKEKLSALGDHLAATMKNMTSKFTLGFGSFVDKVVMPYVSTIPQNLISPCPGCEAPYGFRNMLRLSRDTKQFSQMVKQASVSGNLDAPEGGFDAIMQAIVCRNQIGWREKARRLLVFSTDAGFHYAGDGKLGGIVKPNDGECHLSDKGYYTMSTKQDYPSISQINTYVKQNSINVIFAVTADKISIYKQLEAHIEGSTCGQLSNDSSNVVELIKEQYKAISSVVEMKHNASSDINIRFFSQCLNPNGKLVETNKCRNIKVGSLVKFRVEIEILKCPKNREDWQQTIEIRPVGIDESLIIDLTMICDCPCERHGRKHAPQCHSMGTYMCGICQCDYEAYGPLCECRKNETTSNVTNANCINKNNGLECSGRGSCVCGKCECDTRPNPTEFIYGPQCECDNFSCERHNGQICSGPDHGECHCGICQCKEGWMGSNCACKNATEKCIPEKYSNYTSLNESMICSGHGVCECGSCKCDVTDKGPWFGRWCEYCPNCTDECEKYKNCVQCLTYKTGPYQTEKECEERAECLEFDIVKKDTTIEVNETNNEILCAYYDEEDCRFTFVYYFNDTTKRNEVRVQKERECPPIIFLLGVILGVIAVVVLIGLAILLLWKLFTTIHDRKEFARFEKEAMMARWDTGENPIYKQATSTFKNPTYAGKS